MKSFFRALRLSQFARKRAFKSNNLSFETLEPRAMLTASAPVVISEIMYHPSSENLLQEYVELNNTTGADIDLQNWEFTDGVKFTFPAVTLPANGYLAVAADVPTFQAKYPGVTNVVGGWTGKLSDHSEQLTLENNLGQTVNELTYADEGEWSERERGPLDRGHYGWTWDNATDGEGYSLELRQRLLPNEQGGNWGKSTVLQGTPGVVNSNAQTNVAPVISGVSHFPIIPQSTDPVTISATVIDEIANGVTVQTLYRLDGAPSFTALTMFDDGLHGDGAANDQVYAAQIPAQSNDAIIEFYVSAMDSTSLVSAFPTPSQPSNQQLTNFLYQVDDTFDPANPSGGSEFPGYRLIMTELERAELETLVSTSSEWNSNAQMNGTFISINGATVEARYNVGIRNRGAGSRNNTPHNFRINIPSDKPWQGIDSFNLNTQYTQAQLTGLNFYELTGQPAEDAQAITMKVNGTNLSGSGSPSYGVYVQFETAGGDFVDNHFPADNDGNLYRVVRNSGNANGDLRVLPDPADYELYYEKKTNETTSDHADIVELVDKLNNTPDAGYLSMLQSTVDIDNWVSYFATYAILASEETSLATGYGDDYLIYHGVNDPRFKLIPHDFDTILGQGDTNGSPTSGIYEATSAAAIDRFLNHSAILPLYHAKLNDLLTSTFSKVQFDSVIHDRLDGFTPAAIVTEMVDFMDARREYILDLVDQSLTIENTLPKVGGYHRATEDHAAVSGVASKSQTQSVLVNGQLANWDPVAGTWNLGTSLGGATTVIQEGANWRYLDNGDVASTATGSDWRTLADPGWTKSGDAKLGYGDDETTTVDFLETNGSKNITTYFHKTFDIVDATDVYDLTLRLLRDDGAIVFLNGNEVLRDNLPETGPITSTTEAESVVSGSNEDSFFSFALDHSFLVTGQNVLAVEIHQVSGTSSDISFDAELIASLGVSGSIGGATLLPGVNRLTATSYSGLNGTGEVLDSQYVDVWYDSGVSQSVPGQTINTNVVWTLTNSPYVVTGEIIVGTGGTLTVEPGVTVFFESGTGLEVTDTGRIDAQGTESQRIHMTYNPATSSGWSGLQINNTQTDNRFTYLDFVGGAQQGAAVELNTGKALFDHVSWSGFQQQVLDLVRPRLVVSNSYIPGISGDETVHSTNMETDGQLEFINNVIGVNTSGGDVFDMGHSSPIAPTAIVRGNHFLGGYDDGIDTDGMKVIIENNIFENFHYGTSRSTTSNAVSTGHVTVGGVDISSDLQLSGNIFINNDHHLLLKDGSQATLINNTMVDATVAAISLSEPSGSAVIGPGASITMDGNIVWGYPVFFEAQEPTTVVIINRSLVSSELVGSGVGNISGDPLFIDPFNRNFGLQIGSPALGTGPGGTNMGAVQNNVGSASSVVISEIHFNPADPTPAEIAAGYTDNDDFEFIELYNPLAVGTINLNGMQLSNGVTFDFGNFDLLPGQRAVIAEDVDAFMARYGNSATVLGQWSGGLSNGGEKVTLIDSVAAEVMSVDYGDNDPWYIPTDGHGFSLVLDDPSNTPAAEIGKYYSWRASTEFGGTPGAASGSPTGVVINEVLAHTDAPQSDSIELFNPTASAIDVSGWYLSDAGSDLLKYQIPADTVISAGGFLVFDESDFNPTPLTPGANDFALNAALGDQVYLSQASGGTFIGLEDAVEFDATFNGESLGRLPNGTGRLTRLAENSFGSANGVAAVGPLVISEVHYHPEAPSAAALAIDPLLVDNDLEYIEIANPTSAAIDLTNWRIRGESDFDFAAGTSLPAGEAIVVVPFSPAVDTTKLAAFKAHYGITAGVTIVGGLSASLSNSSGRIALQQPDAPDALGVYPNVVVDEVVYDDLAPWPAADGSGQSLERDDLGANGNFSTSWISASPTPGAFESPFLIGDLNQDGVVDFLDISPFISALSSEAYLDAADINRDGEVDFLDISPFISLLSSP